MKDGQFVILCIDDDPDVLRVLRLILENHGYCMVEAASAESGVKAYRRHEPDFVIVDLMMESVDAGKSFATELRLLGNTAPVYMLSSIGDALAANVSFTDLGLTGVFQKPLDAETLLTTLRIKLKKPVGA